MLMQFVKEINIRVKLPHRCINKNKSVWMAFLQALNTITYLNDKCGGFYLIFTVDDDNQHPETDESNNQIWSTFLKPCTGMKLLYYHSCAKPFK